MEMQTIGAVPFMGTIFSIIVSIGVPIALMVIGKKKFGAKISTFFIGAGTFLLFAMILEQILHILVIRVLGLDAKTNEWLYYFYGACAAAVFEETGRIVAMKWFMKKRFDLPNAFMYGIGHGGVEAILIGGLANIGGLINMIMINNGMMQASLAILPEEVQAQTVEQLSTLWTTPQSYFFASGIERLSAVIIHIGLSLIIYKGLKDSRKGIIAMAYGCHFLVDFVAVALAPRLSVWFIELIIFALAIAIFMLAHKVNKDNSVEKVSAQG